MVGFQITVQGTGVQWVTDKVSQDSIRYMMRRAKYSSPAVVLLD